MNKAVSARFLDIFKMLHLKTRIYAVFLGVINRFTWPATPSKCCTGNHHSSIPRVERPGPQRPRHRRPPLSLQLFGPNPAFGGYPDHQHHPFHLVRYSHRQLSRRHPPERKAECQLRIREQIFEVASSSPRGARTSRMAFADRVGFNPKPYDRIRDADT